MMDILLGRRSIRKYTRQPVPDAWILALLRAAMAAPSAGNQQPWEFVVIRDSSVTKHIPSFHPHAQMAPEAPVVIAVCGNLHNEKHAGMWVQDCAAATENLLLAAHAKGLGAVWLGIYPRESRLAGMKKLLQLPDHIVPFAVIPVGFPGEQKPPAERFDETKIHYNRW